MEYIAHIDDKQNVQTILEHSLNTAILSKIFAIDELKDICYTIGLMHDIGKYTSEFQQRIRGKAIKVEHSVCGAIEVKETYKDPVLILLMELCIAGHHTGIPNIGLPTNNESDNTLYARIRRKTGDYSAYKNELALPTLDGGSLTQLLKQKGKDIDGITEIFAFIVRFCFSCLTDADSIDSAAASGDEDGKELTADFDECRWKLEERLNSFLQETALQKARCALQKQAVATISEKESGIYLMNMPTGSGKTLASMRCALQLVESQKLKRIIYVIPYNSIIDQTVSVFEKLFGDSAQILRHQSSFSYEAYADIDEGMRYNAEKACENWNAQIVITTAVQFFESLYADKRGKLRKVHNMADSVIIFDEAHLMPVDYLQPCLRAVVYLTQLLHSKAIFLTATMPDYHRMIHEYVANDVEVIELITDKREFSAFTRCKYEYIGKQEDDALVHMSSVSPSSLIIVNSKKAARDIYSLCGGKKYHLSTYMTAIDRVNTIKEIRQAIDELCKDYPDLTNVPEERRITVVSTSLIEAGVDLDFADVYRELWGLDSILQAGGRCNREGKRSNGHVYVFERTNNKTGLKPNAAEAKALFEEFSNISDSKAIETYYERLMYIDKERHMSMSLKNRFNCRKPTMIPFRDYSAQFKLIDDEASESIVVCRDDVSISMRQQLMYSGKVSIRAVQPYCCSVSNRDFDELRQQGVIDDYGSGIYFLTNDAYYDAETGIRFSGEDYFI